MFANLSKVTDVVTSLNGTIAGSIDVSWNRVADFYVALTEAIEFLALSLTTFGVVLAIRLAWRIKSSREANNPITGG